MPKSICVVPGYAVILPIISQEHEQTHDEQLKFNNDNDTVKNIENRKTPERRWKCPTCKFNRNAHYRDSGGEERAAGLSTAEQRQDPSFSDQSYQHRQRTANYANKLKDRTSSYAMRKEKNYHHREDIVHEANPYFLKIFIVPSTPNKEQPNQNLRKNKDHVKKYGKTIGSSQNNKDSRRRVMIKCEADISMGCHGNCELNQDYCEQDKDE
ncbi:hypothetical protein JTE90_025980 [Oedothorax gibbosus]|uniref:Uncharacterized protein n=1 Tax=Oedothorax gibbosus TaxID=931172 RepID=A0AAV6U7K1_9ARAC|nr:hypothetical protein JTE90_025980 [Oedothorax gibbosus]